MRIPFIFKTGIAIMALLILATCSKLSVNKGPDVTAPSCSLTAPNGGELWYIGADYDITWEASDDDSIAFFILEYSIDETDNWVMIGDTISGDIRDTSWTIPSTATLIGRVRIFCQDAAGNVSADTSDEFFTIWPQGGMIAFASDRDGDSDIFTIYAGGSVPHNLTGSVGDDFRPKWSPDCSRIAFHSNREGNWEVYVMNNDGTAQINISNNSNDDAHPAWSPSGDKIAFSSKRRNGVHYDIWIMNLNDNSQIPLTDNDWHEYGVDWSPLGDKIVYHDNQDGDWEIFTIDSEGQNDPERLTNNGFYDAYPAWSPDGQMIAFCSNRDGNYEIYTINANGSGQTRITYDQAEDNRPAWSPDGSRIVFESYRTGDGEIWIVDPNNLSDLQNISNDLAVDKDPSWSPIH